MKIEEAFKLVNDYIEKNKTGDHISQKGCKRYKNYYIFPVSNVNDDVSYFLDTNTNSIECTNILFHPLNLIRDEYDRNVEFLKYDDGQFKVIRKGEPFTEIEASKASVS